VGGEGKNRTVQRGTSKIESSHVDTGGSKGLSEKELLTGGTEPIENGAVPKAYQWTDHLFREEPLADLQTARHKNEGGRMIQPALVL